MVKYEIKLQELIDITTSIIRLVKVRHNKEFNELSNDDLDVLVLFGEKNEKGKIEVDLWFKDTKK